MTASLSSKAAWPQSGCVSSIISISLPICTLILSDFVDGYNLGLNAKVSLQISDFGSVRVVSRPHGAKIPLWRMQHSCSDLRENETHHLDDF